jgi:hypothetical protein
MKPTMVISFFSLSVLWFGFGMSMFFLNFHNFMFFREELQLYGYLWNLWCS